MESYRIFKTGTPQTIASLLMMTGQEHEKRLIRERYDRTIALLGKELTPYGVATLAVGAVGINDAENRIVDIAVHPDFRRRGIGRTLVDLSKCDVAYTVEEDAEKFWEGIGWTNVGKKLDKDTLVKVWVNPNVIEEAKTNV